MKREIKVHPGEPLFYFALVLKGTEQQYLKLLRYIENRNHAQIIYQCKSLTYLYITKNPQMFKIAPPEDSPEISHRKLRGKTQ